MRTPTLTYVSPPPRFTVKHVHTQACSPFHGGLSFLTSHAAFTLELDQSLQAINPKLTQPYW